jgi:sugar phosphate isomerase/epimerase
MNGGAASRVGRYDLGVQSFTYRTFTVGEMCEELADTGVSAVELCHEHVTPGDGPEDIDAVQEQLASAGLEVCGYGVVDVDADDEAFVRETLALVDRLGGSYCSLEFPPAAEGIRSTLLSNAADHDLDLAIHNHGPEATYETVEDVLAVLEGTPDRRLGACVDTGHFFRSGQTPRETITRLGDRVHALHLKDFLDESTETVPGKGQLDMGELVGLLDAETSLSRPLVIEYEADPDDPTPAVVETVEAVSRAMEQ